MKNIKLIFFALVSLLVVLPLYTYAGTITNDNGVVMTEEEYNNFLKVYTEDYIMLMTQEKYEHLKEFDFSNVDTKTIYVETKYNPHLGITTDKVISKEQYDKINPGLKPNLNDGGDYEETTAKTFSLNLVGGSVWNRVVATATWKSIPSTRSFDLIGFRSYGFDFSEGTQEGTQIYKENGTRKSISYGYNGTNIKKFNRSDGLNAGYGISMNIVNNTISYLQATTECDVTPTLTHPSIYASYQHAVKDITLAQSQTYTLGGAGLGEVFVFTNGMYQYYDDMNGLNLQY